MVTSRKTTKVRPSFILNQNREASLEDSASVEGFLWVWGFNGEQWRFVVAVSDGERAWDIGNGFGRKKDIWMYIYRRE